MNGMDVSQEPGLSSRFQGRLVLRLIGLACLAALAFFARKYIPRRPRDQDGQHEQFE